MRRTAYGLCCVSVDGRCVCFVICLGTRKDRAEDCRWQGGLSPPRRRFWRPASRQLRINVLHVPRIPSHKVPADLVVQPRCTFGPSRGPCCRQGNIGRRGPIHSCHEWCCTCHFVVLTAAVMFINSQENLYYIEGGSQTREKQRERKCEKKRAK